MHAGGSDVDEVGVGGAVEDGGAAAGAGDPALGVEVAAEGGDEVGGVGGVGGGDEVVVVAVIAVVVATGILGPAFDVGMR